jgi:hypothetical protein
LNLGSEYRDPSDPLLVPDKRKIAIGVCVISRLLELGERSNSEKVLILGDKILEHLSPRGFVCRDQGSADVFAGDGLDESEILVGFDLEFRIAPLYGVTSAIDRALRGSVSIYAMS